MTSKFHVFNRCTVGYLTALINKKMLTLGIFIFSTYIMEVNIAWLIIHDVRLSACEKHMRNYEMPTITRHTFTYHLQLEEITIHRNDLLLQIQLSGWKRHVRMCSRGWRFSPFLPGCNYLNLSSKTDQEGEISGNIVQVLRSFFPFHANNTIWVLFFAKA